MPGAGLEINDAGLALAAGGALLADSPGYALYEGRELWIGDAARRRARVSPRLVSHGFWDRLGTEALPRAVGHARTYADLAALHLEQVWRGAGGGLGPLVLAVPASFTRTQLGLLLGVAEQLELPVAGLIDSAVACIGPVPGGAGRLVHLEAQLHALLATAVEPGPRTRRDGAERIDGHGLLAVHERVVAVIAAQFVRETRFDPLHRGISEQRLHDGLEGWLAELASAGAVRIEVESAAGARHAVEFEATALAPVCDELADAVAGRLRRFSPPPVEVLIGHRLAALPGFAERLADVLGVGVRGLERGATALGAAAQTGYVSAHGGPRKLTVEVGPVQPVDDAPDHRPTHVVHDGVALPIGGDRVALGAAPGPPPALRIAGLDAPVHCVLEARDGTLVVDALAALTVNGMPVTRDAPVRAGDRLRLGDTGVEVELVRVVDGPAG